MLKRYSKKTLMIAVEQAVNLGQWQPTGHAIKRMRERNITLPEIQYVLLNGFHNPRKDDRSDNDWKYAIDGITKDQKRIRVSVFFDEIMLIVTVIDLDLEE